MNKKGEISDIDKIYNSVLAEGKKVNESLKSVNSKVASLGKGFLSFFSKAEEEKTGGLLEDHIDFKDIS